LAVALARLEGSAYDFSEGTVFNSWMDFKGAITQRYGEDKQVMKHKLSKCKQTMGEGILSYVDRFKFLAMRANITDGEEILNKFLGGLIPALYDRVMVCCPISYDQAVEKAIYFSKKLTVNGKGHLLQSEGQEQRSSLRMPFSGAPPQPQRSGRFERPNPGNSYQQQQQSSSGPAQPRPSPPSRPEAPGVRDLASEFDSKLKMNTRSTNVYRDGPRHVMTRSTSYPSHAFSMWSDSTSEGSMSDSDTTRARYTHIGTDVPFYPVSPRFQAGLAPSDMNARQAQDATQDNPVEPDNQMPMGEANMPALSMRRTIDTMHDMPRVYERMEIDGMAQIPKPHSRKPFPTSNHTMHTLEPEHGGVPSGGPRIMRRPPGSRPPGVTFADQQQQQQQSFDAPSSTHMSRNELRILDELFSCIKVRNLGIEELSDFRVNEVLSALAQKIRDTLVGPKRTTSASAAKHEHNHQSTHFVNYNHVKVPNSTPTPHAPRSLYYDVLQAKMAVSGTQTPVIVDTGSTTCAVSKEFCQRLGLLEAVQETDIIYVNADGVECQAPGLLPNVLIQVRWIRVESECPSHPWGQLQFSGWY
jgi:hypothetical protein